MIKLNLRFVRDDGEDIYNEELGEFVSYIWLETTIDNVGHIDYVQLTSEAAHITDKRFSTYYRSYSNLTDPKQRKKVCISSIDDTIFLEIDLSAKPWYEIIEYTEEEDTIDKLIDMLNNNK
jgi:hypothetical protein